MPDRTFDILIDIRAQAAALDDSIRKLQQLNVASGEVALKSAQAASSVGALGSVLAGVAGGAVAIGIGTVVSALIHIPQEISKAIAETNQWTRDIINQGIKVDEEIQKWNQLARTADSFKDVVKLSNAIAADLHNASALFSAWRTKELSAWQSFFDIIASQFSAIPGFGHRPFQEAADAAAKESRAQLVTSIQAQSTAIDQAKRSLADWERQQKNLGQAVPELKAKITGLTTAIQEQELIISKVAELGPQATDIDLHNAEASVIERARLNQELETTRDHLDKVNREQAKLSSGTGAERDARREITDLLREDTALLRSLQAEQGLIEQNPFLGADEKQAALHANAIQQQQALQASITNTKNELDKAYGSGTQQDITQLQDKLSQLQIRFAELGYTISTTTFGGQFAAQLVQWVNSFGTAAQAAAQIVTGTLNTAIGSASQALTGLIFQTGNWRQTFAQAAQSIVQNIIQIVLQYTVGRAIMAAINLAFGATEAGVVNKQAAAATKAWTPAAIAASIASYGVAAAAGLAAFLAAEVAGTAVATALSSGGGFAGGGFTGYGNPTRVAGVVHQEEVVFEQPVVQKLGLENLLNLRFAAQRGATFQSGGYTGGGASGGSSLGNASSKRDITIIMVRDEREAMEEYLKSHDGEVHVMEHVGKNMWKWT